MANMDRDISGSGRHERRVTQKRFRTYAKTYVQARKRLERSGPGFEIDRFLLSACQGFNNRFSRHGRCPQPVSYRYLRPFLLEEEPIPGFPAAGTRPARPHLFSLVDYLDFVTSPEVPGDDVPGRIMEEGIAYEFSVMGPVDEVVAAEMDGHGVVVSGISMMRRGTMLHWFLVGGEILSEEEWRLERERGAYDHTGEHFNEFVSSGISGEPQPLKGCPQALKAVAMGMWSIEERSHVERSRMYQFSDAWHISFEQAALDGRTPSKATMEPILNTVRRAEPLWAMVETLLKLPDYFAFKVDVQRDVAVEDGVQLPVQPNLDARRSRFVTRPFKVVRSIAYVEDVRRPCGDRTFTPPSYAVEVEGFYRRIAPTSVGMDKDGTPLLGQTWVKSHRRWKDKPERSVRILVKASVGAALDMAARASMQPA